MNLDLPDSLRKATATLHRSLERSAFMKAFLRAGLDRRAYCSMLRNLLPIYEALEQGLRQHALAVSLAPVVIEPLFRSAALRLDLDQLHGPQWVGELELLPSSAAYAAHLQCLAASRPGLLAAHAYVRYLGDLSGGQMLKRLVRSSLALPAGGPAEAPASTAFYEFGTVLEVAALAVEFRAGLRQIGQHPSHAAAIVTEAVLAFEMHASLFDELAEQCGLAQPEINPT